MNLSYGFSFDSQLLSNISLQTQSGKNLAEIVWTLDSEGGIDKESIPDLVNCVLLKSGGYSCLSFNLSATHADWETIFPIVRNWNLFDTVVVYYHPQLGFLLINPLVEAHWSRIGYLSKFELMVVYTRLKGEPDPEREREFLANFKAVCNGITFTKDPQFKRESPEPQPARSPRISTNNDNQPTTDSRRFIQPSDVPPPSPNTRRRVAEQKRQITPKYEVRVTNELFHNGNVEAWRNIIESYETTYKNSTILLYHNNERITHISSLFKWGKVKMGDSIFFSVVGMEIHSIAKLKKYLSGGASPRYKAFIKKDLNHILNLF